MTAIETPLDALSAAEQHASPKHLFEQLPQGQCSFDILTAIRDLADALPREHQQVLYEFSTQLRTSLSEHGLDQNRFRLRCVVGNLEAASPELALKKMAEYLLSDGKHFIANLCLPGLNSDESLFKKHEEGSLPWLARSAAALAGRGEQIAFVMSTIGYEHAPFADPEQTKASPELYANVATGIAELITGLKRSLIITGHSMGCRVATLTAHNLKQRNPEAPPLDLVLLQPAVSRPDRPTQARILFEALAAAVKTGELVTKQYPVEAPAGKQIHSIVEAINLFIVRLMTATHADLSQTEQSVLHAEQRQLMRNGQNTPEVAIDYCHALAQGLDPAIAAEVFSTVRLVVISGRDQIVSPLDIDHFYRAVLMELRKRYARFNIDISQPAIESLMHRLHASGHLAQFSEAKQATAVQDRLAEAGLHIDLMAKARACKLDRTISAHLAAGKRIRITAASMQEAEQALLSPVQAISALKHTHTILSDLQSSPEMPTDQLFRRAQEAFEQINSLLQNYPHMHFDQPLRHVLRDAQDLIKQTWQALSAGIDFLSLSVAGLCADVAQGVHRIIQPALLLEPDVLALPIQFLPILEQCTAKLQPAPDQLPPGLLPDAPGLEPVAFPPPVAATLQPAAGD